MRALKKGLAGSCLLTLLPACALAGGPLVLEGDGTPITWPAGTEVQYRTDNGPLSASVNEGAARTRVNNMFNVWESVASASIGYNRAGFIQGVAGFSDGDVSGLSEYDAVEGDCFAGEQSPIIYDANGSLFEALGIDNTMVIGFAGPCAFDPNQGEIVSGQAVMNGLFQDGVDTADSPELTAAEFDAVFIHEFGHFSGLDHSQINVECAFVLSCGSDNLDGLPTMFPFLVSAEQGTLSIDDIAWISKLYPAAGGGGFNATHGHITGTVFFSDGESHAQLVNVIARRVDDGGTATDESRTMATSNVSGYRFRFFHGNPITDPLPSPFGGTDPALIGFYEIPLPPGSYMIEVESIDAAFVEGSSVGGPVRIDMPGAAPAPIGPINVTAGATDSGNDVTLIATEPRFDQFEGP